ncbi:hypothetical protein TrVE_jg5807 [Triparma verrucosa]|uniref:Leucine rich repeat-containing protein n=1 Tax=Triparma verrucosa TaxID=1606542 RepID=A0A9W7KRW0_9STRA|nr:hypothetical protein TrVE_jg5807 [Triparma verrucosa]
MVEVVYQKGDGKKYKGQEDITKVTVASDVDEIAEYAFYRCRNLTEFNFGDSKVTKIGRSALHSTVITKIKLPDTLKVIGSWAFSKTNLTEVEINAEKIEGNTFCDCQSLVKVVLKEGITTVETNAFDGCPNISTFIWADSVKEVGYSVFRGCDKLHELAGSKDQEKIIEYLKSFTPLIELCSQKDPKKDPKRDIWKSIARKRSPPDDRDWTDLQKSDDAEDKALVKQVKQADKAKLKVDIKKILDENSEASKME